MATIQIHVPTAVIRELEVGRPLQICPHPPAPSPKWGEGEPD
jgi:hypothetical protein